MTAVSPSGMQAHHDPILESDPPRRLDIPNERPSRVTFVVEASKGQTKLTVTHDEFEEGSRIFGMIRNGWPAVLSSLKSFLETGQGLEPSWDDDERKRAAQA
jgi:hypothetical protein